ncbi:hypothetical protein TNCV_423901 [Trichonephila clavipes]|nr:hypothetical protein TNCV_423901 [Trichonephila clavipes]
MKSKHQRFCVAQRIFQHGSGNEGKKRNRFEQTSRTLQRKISMRSTKDQLVEKICSYAGETQCFPVETFRMSKRCLHDGEKLFSPLGLHGNTAADSVRSGNGRCGMQPKPSSLRAQAQQTKTKNFLDIRAERAERERKEERESYTRATAFPNNEPLLASGIGTVTGQRRPRVPNHGHSSTVTNDDEAHFWLNGYVNKQNCRIWSEANPQVYVETPLHPEKLTVWCALWAGGILLQKR